MLLKRIREKNRLYFQRESERRIGYPSKENQRGESVILPKRIREKNRLYFQRESVRRIVYPSKEYQREEQAMQLCTSHFRGCWVHSRHNFRLFLVQNIPALPQLMNCCNIPQLRVIIDIEGPLNKFSLSLIGKVHIGARALL